MNFFVFFKIYIINRTTLSTNFTLIIIKVTWKKFYLVRSYENRYKFDIKIT